MNTKSITQSSNPVLAGSLPALRRSAKRAKKIAAQTGTRLVVVPAPHTPRKSPAKRAKPKSSSAARAR